MTDISAQHSGAVPSSTAATVSLAGTRLREIDMLRGLVIVLMALDHVRDYFHSGAFTFSPLDPDRTNVALYATRWITHVCAPTFVFLAGVSAFLQAAKGKEARQLSFFLASRGLWLIALELTVVSFGWSFALPYPLLLQVIWAIGWSMVVLAGLVWLPRPAVLALGLAVLAGHNLLDHLTPDDFGSWALAWTFLHEGGLLMLGDIPVGFALYPILPWIGVMALGYGMGSVFLEPAPKRDRTLLLLGGMSVALFILLRGLNLYGNSKPWMAQDSLVRSAMAFLDVEKYPPSLMYVLVMLGGALLMMPLLARLRGPAGTFLLTFGAVPLFFYILHIYAVHALAMGANAALGRDVTGMINFFVNTITAPMALVSLMHRRRRIASLEPTSSALRPSRPF